MTLLKHLIIYVNIILLLSITALSQSEVNPQIDSQNSPHSTTNISQVSNENQIESKKLLIKAKALINEGKYKEGKNILIRAIELDPNNEEAKNMLINLNEVISLEERQQLEQQRQVIAQRDANQANMSANANNADIDTHLFKIGIDIIGTYSKSNVQNIYNSKVWAIGAGSYLEFFPNQPKLKGILGFRIDYTTIFIKLKPSYPKYFFNMININAIARFKFSKKKNSAEIAGYLGYRYYSLKNFSKYDFQTEGLSQGLYSYTSILGFTFGFYFRDTLLNYLIKTKTSEKIILYIKFDILPAFKSSNPNVFLLSGGFDFILNEKFTLDLRATRYIIKSKTIEENFVLFSVGFSYKF